MRNSKSTTNLKTSYQQKFEKLCKKLDMEAVFNLMNTKFDTNYLSIPKVIDDKYRVVLERQGIDVEKLDRNWIAISSDSKNLRDDAAIFVKNNDGETIMVYPKLNFSFCVSSRSGSVCLNSFGR
ncbi:hypothetical protein, partial [Brucella thiophenivorans]